MTEGLLSARIRQILVQRIFSTAAREELRTPERQIATHYASTPVQRAVNDGDLQRLRSAALARR